MLKLRARQKSAARDLTVGKPLPLIIGFMIPLFFGIIFQQLYNMADTMVVGKFLGVDALAGVGSTGSINFLILGFCMGACQGFAIPVAQKFGEKDFDGLRKYIGNILLLSIVFAVVFTVGTTVLCRKILVWMDTPQEVFAHAYDYIIIIFAGTPITIAYNTLSGIIRSLGDSKSPVYFLVISSIFNIVLDIVFIVTFKMGVSGAALATILSQLVSGILCLIYMHKKFEITHLSRDDLKPRAEYITNLLWMAIPMGLQFSITAIGSTILQVAINGLGAASVAAMTAAMKVQMFVGAPLSALGTTMATYGGQNVGAKKLRRIDIGVKYCVLLGSLYSVLSLIIFYLFADGLIGLFVDQSETEIIEKASQFLVISGWFFIPLTLIHIYRMLIQGVGYSKVAMFAGVFELVARLVIALVLVPRFGFTAVCFSDPMAWVMAIIFMIPAYYVIRKHLYKKLGESVVLD